MSHYVDDGYKNVNLWLGKIGTQQGITLSLDETGHACLVCDNNLKVFIEVPHNSDFVFLYTPLAPLPKSSLEQNDLFKKALELNNFSLETGSASIGFDKRTSAILLTFSEKISALDYAYFSECLGNFIQLAYRISTKF